jgi:poly-beta-1,6-N-acetyl-D-glucosamine N-deacetylase
MRSQLYNFLDQFSSIYLNNHPLNFRVLAYHTVPDALKFDKQIQYLVSNYNIVDIETLLNSIEKREKLPDNSILITFDDGDFSVYKNGLPVLKKYNLPAVLFIITDLIETSKAFWWKQVEAYYKSQDKTYSEARQKVNYLKNISEKERKKYLSTLPGFNQRQLKVKELKEMSQNGFAIANHTHTHPMINNCTIKEMEAEFDKVQEKFDEWNFSHFNIFAYPNGNWSDETENYIRSRGIKIAFLFNHQLNPITINPLRISRISVDATEALPEFRAKVSGLHPKLLSLRKSLNI